MEPNDLLRDAQALAEFSNLEVEKADYFRNNYPEFVPENWWTAPPFSTSEAPEKPRMLWEIQKERLQEAWKERFPLNASIRLINVGMISNLLASNLTRSFDAVWPYQKAVMFLGTNPWRACVCICGNRFVADKPARRFCSDQCFQQSRRRSKQAWWSENGEMWREGRLKVTAKKPKMKSREGRKETHK